MPYIQLVSATQILFLFFLFFGSFLQLRQTSHHTKYILYTSKQNKNTHNVYFYFTLCFMPINRPAPTIPVLAILIGSVRAPRYFSAKKVSGGYSYAHRPIRLSLINLRITSITNILCAISQAIAFVTNTRHHVHCIRTPNASHHIKEKPCVNKTI